MDRRGFVKLAVASAGAATLASCGRNPQRGDQVTQRRVLVVAFDGLDPRVLESLLAAKRVPNFARLAPTGRVPRIATSMPPHTPVAFSSIISGADPGTHQIFDFIHRDANPPTDAPIRPFFSTADTDTSEQQHALTLGKWRLPISGGGTKLLRRGPPFWDHLIARGVDTDIYYLPANYPPQCPAGPGRFRAVGGMGTPDLLGTYGEFTLLTPDAPKKGRDVGGGRITQLRMIDHRGHAEINGPPNFLREPDAFGRVDPIPLAVHVIRDPQNDVAKVNLSGQSVLLAAGEWSRWIPVEFPTGVPGTTVLRATGAPTSMWGMVRLYLKSVHPVLVLYVSPVNIDPLRPAMPFTVPENFSQEIGRRHGRFHTLGIPEDTKALSHGALSEEEFLAQAAAAMAERRDQFRSALAQFESGCLFFYFGSSDLLQHMFWRDRDPEHPGHVAEQAARFGHIVDDVYIQADEIVGEALAALREDDTLIVLSDHGFTTFRRGFNLNTWLLENDYLKLRPGNWQGTNNLFANVEWGRVRAYGLGMNGLYLNAVDREKHGIVKRAERRSLLGEIRDKLLEVRDGDKPVITRVELTEDVYPSADPKLAPDLIIGYNNAYRASWETVLGEMPDELVVDNLDRWSGEHLIDADLVPGMLLSNRPLAARRPSVCDIAPTILAAFNIAKPPEMTGHNMFAEREDVRV